MFILITVGFGSWIFNYRCFHDKSPPPSGTFIWPKQRPRDLEYFLGLTQILLKKREDLARIFKIVYSRVFFKNRAKFNFWTQQKLAKKGGEDLTCHFDISSISVKKKRGGLSMKGMVYLPS